MSLRDKTARPSLGNYPSVDLEGNQKQHPTTATLPTSSSASEPMSTGADKCSEEVNIKVGDRVVCEPSTQIWEVRSVVNSITLIVESKKNGVIRVNTTCNKTRIATPEEIKAERRIDYCPHGYDIACLICGFGIKNGKRVYHTPPPVVINIESMSATKLAEFKEGLQQAKNNIYDGFGMPSALLATGSTGGEYELPFKSKEEWRKALLNAQTFDPNSMRRSDWPTDWPTDANFYRINVNTPIFYKYESGEIKRWIKYAKCWVDSCITDWHAFSRQNAVQGLRSWPTDKMSITLLDEYGYRDDLDMIRVRGEFPAETDPVNLTDQIVINALSYCVRSSSQIYRLINEAGHAVTPLALRIRLDSLVDRKLAETKRDLLSGEKVWRLLERAHTNNNSESNGLENNNG